MQNYLTQIHQRRWRFWQC